MTVEIDRLLTPGEVGQIMQVSTNALAQWRHRNQGPKFIKVGTSVRYSAKELQKYIDQGGDK